MVLCVSISKCLKLKEGNFQHLSILYGLQELLETEAQLKKYGQFLEDYASQLKGMEDALDDSLEIHGFYLGPSLFASFMNLLLYLIFFPYNFPAILV